MINNDKDLAHGRISSSFSTAVDPSIAQHILMPDPVQQDALEDLGILDMGDLTLAGVILVVEP